LTPMLSSGVLCGSQMNKNILDDRLFSIEQIKAAFWDNFHRAGEVWFDYLGDAENDADSTDCHWQDFLDTLERLGDNSE